MQHLASGRWRRDAADVFPKVRFHAVSLATDFRSGPVDRQRTGRPAGAADLSCLRYAGCSSWRTVPSMLGRTGACRRSGVRCLRHADGARCRAGGGIGKGGRASAGLEPGTGRGGVQRGFATAGACAQVSRPARGCARHGADDGACRPRASGRGRYCCASAAAPLAAVVKTVQPVSAALAAEVAKLSGRRLVPDLAVRVRRTRAQVGLGQSERNRNVKGAFSVSRHRAAEVMGRKVVLVDDVLTSGATASECARALLKAGAAEVDVLVFALVSGGA